MSEVEWRAIPNYEGMYEVSDDGRVRSLDRLVYAGRGRMRTERGRELKQWKHGVGYRAVSLHRNDKGLSHLVHALVALAFIGPRPIGHDVRHRDGSKTNNHRDNLLYGTRAENVQDSIEQGTFQRGARNGQSKLDEQDASLIRHSQVPNWFLADWFGMSRATISNIRNRKAWRHLT